MFWAFTIDYFLCSHKSLFDPATYACLILVKDFGLLIQKWCIFFSIIFTAVERCWLLVKFTEPKQVKMIELAARVEAI